MYTLQSFLKPVVRNVRFSYDTIAQSVEVELESFSMEQVLNLIFDCYAPTSVDGNVLQQSQKAEKRDHRPILQLHSLLSHIFNCLRFFLESNFHRFPFALFVNLVGWKIHERVFAIFAYIWPWQRNRTRAFNYEVFSLVAGSLACLLRHWRGGWKWKQRRGNPCRLLCLGSDGFEL